MSPTLVHRQLGKRVGVVAAALAGFVLGAAGFAAAHQAGPSVSEVALPAAATGPSASVDDGAATVGAPTTALGVPTTARGGAATTTAEVPTNTAAAPPTTALGVPTTAGGGAPSTTSEVPTTVDDDGPTTTIGDVPTTTVDDDGPATTIGDVPTTTVDDDGPATTIDDVPTTTAVTGLPDPFTTTFSSTGGSITVSWSGTAFTLVAVSPAPGFFAEIEDQSWERVRVDFEGDDDARIEVRIDDGRLRVRVD